MKFPIATVTLSVVLAGLFLGFGALPEHLIWQQQSSYSWQILSTHFVHISTDHFVWNLAAFIILASVIEQHSMKRLLNSIILGCASISLYLLFLYELPAYAGLSGALNTLLVVALYQIAQKTEYRSAALLSFILSIAKIVFEWSTGNTVFSTLIWPAVPAAHLAGLIGGIIYCLILDRNKKNQLRLGTF